MDQANATNIAASLRMGRSHLARFDKDAKTDINETMAVLLLSNNAQQICCALKNFSGHLVPWTPVHFFVFSVENHLGSQVPDDCRVGLHLAFMKLDAHLVTPQEAETPDLWSAPHFNEEYRRMGHWRLAFQMQFASRLGYRYILQLDDDSAFMAPLRFNLVQHMSKYNLRMAARNIIESDGPDVTRGLAELARFFLVSEDVRPTKLLSECIPANISGLYTHGLSSQGDGGYSTKYLFGNFVVISLEFWFQPTVQRFVKLVLRTGAHFRYRWNEQQVQSVVWQMFLSPEEFSLFDFPYDHPVKPWTCV